MTAQKEFSTSVVVEKSPTEVYAAINNVQGWWQGEITGENITIGDEFNYQMGTVHLSKQKVMELIPDEKVVWLVTESQLSFVEIKDEWTGTTLVFDIKPEGNKTKLTFTHHGLTPTFQCFEACSGGWSMLIQKSLFNLITTGKGVDVF